VAAEGSAKTARAAADALKEEAAFEASIRDKDRAAGAVVRELREAVDPLSARVSNVERGRVLRCCGGLHHVIR
jgi:hypothetical protein